MPIKITPMRRCLLPIFLLASLFCAFANHTNITYIAPNIGPTTSITGDCRCADSLNLVDFYNALDGPNWIEDWDFTLPLEEWKGIGLNLEGCVESIRLNSNNLSGAIPENIAAFTALESLSLGNNLLTGSIPPVINRLRLLESLNLRNNQLSGPIPADLDNLKRLTTINLSVNQLSGPIPPTIGNLTTLTGLFLNQNQLTGPVPSFLENLDQLVSLNLGSNELTGSIPSILGLLTNLTGVGLDNNQLTGELPFSLGFLSNLVSLRLENNQLTGSIPEEYGQLTRVETIILRDNNLSGCYPESLLIFCPLGEGTFGQGYNFTNNPQLPWQGNFTNFCNGEIQMGASCTNGVDSTLVIRENCTCGEFIEEPIIESIPSFENFRIRGTCPMESTGLIQWNNSSPTTTYTIEWVNPDNIITTLSQQSNLLLEDLSNGLHTLTFIDDANTDLVFTEQIEIPLLSCVDIGQVPQAITPNGDGLNDRFIFDPLENNPSAFPDNEIVIFNRWGDIIYTAKPYNNEWSGTNASGRSLPEGTYYYVFKLDLNQGLIINGSVTILR